jgi:hypothetical protein
MLLAVAVVVVIAIATLLSRVVDFDKKNGHDLLSTFETACNSGNTNGCFNAGQLFDRGRKVDQDFSRAAHFYEMGCDRDDVACCHHLAVLHQMGQGVQKSEPKAIELYEKACKNRYQPACFSRDQIRLK